MSISRKMPTKKSIYEYWHCGEGRRQLLLHGIELENQHDIFGKTKFDCFACGDILKIQRCHILAKTLGGLDDASNLHLLCSKCHVESEFITVERYWVWLKHMLSEQWQEATEHLYQRRKKSGYNEKEVLEAYKKNGIQGALAYMSYFESETEKDRENFVNEFIEKLNKLQKL